MVKLQRFFTNHRQSLVILMTILIIIAELCHFGLHIQYAYQIIMAVAGIIGLLPILLTAISSLQVKMISIDVLVSLAIIGAFFIGEFNEAAIVSWLFLLGEVLENITLHKTRSAVQKLSQMAPQTALVIGENQDIHEEDVDFLDSGDRVLVKTGMQVPVDGIVTKGSGSVNEASVTGEAKLVTKGPHQQVYAGTILENGTLTISTTAAGEETTFGKIIELVEEAQDSKNKAQRFIDQFAQYYTPAVLVISVFVGLLTKNLTLAITVMVLGCPGALVIGTPASTVAGIGNGARHGLLFKSSEVMSKLKDSDMIVFDKTGTLTKGQPQVADIQVINGSRQASIDAAVAIEKNSAHPLAKAIARLDAESTVDAHDVKTIKGQGVTGFVNDQQFYLGKLDFIRSLANNLPQSLMTATHRLAAQGDSIVILASTDLSTLAIFGIRDVLRSDAKTALSAMQKMGKRLVMLTGDNVGTAKQISQELPLDEFHADMLPADKSEFIKKAQASGQLVTFVGDGINDGPAISQADVGVAMGSGTDVAMDIADLVLVQSQLSNLVNGITLAKKTTTNMNENIVIALLTVLLLFIGLFLGYIHMASGMFIHEISILIVIINSMRLINFSPKHD